MRAIAAIPPYAPRPNSWPNETEIARYEKYFPDGGGRRGRRQIGIIPSWTGKAIGLPLRERGESYRLRSIRIGSVGTLASAAPRASNALTMV